MIGFAGGDIPSVKANRILLKNISVVGLHWGAYAQHEPERIPEVFASCSALYEAGRPPRIFGSYPLDQVSEALERSAHAAPTARWSRDSEALSAPRGSVCRAALRRPG